MNTQKQEGELERGTKAIANALENAPWPEGTERSKLNIGNLGDDGWYHVEMWIKPPVEARDGR